MHYNQTDLHLLDHVNTFNQMLMKTHREHLNLVRVFLAVSDLCKRDILLILAYLVLFYFCCNAINHVLKYNT